MLGGGWRDGEAGGWVGEQVGGEKVDGWVMDESVDGWVGKGDLVDGGVDEWMGRWVGTWMDEFPFSKLQTAA